MITNSNSGRELGKTIWGSKQVWWHMKAPAGPDISHNTAHTLLTVITVACEISKQACKTKTKGGV